MMPSLHKSLFRLAWIFLFCTAVPCAHAIGDMKFRHLTAKDGLGANAVYCTFQDHSGMIWFGTCEGLSRYDTYGIETFRLTPGDFDAFGKNSIYSIAEDSLGHLWLGTITGLIRFDIRSRSFNKIPVHDKTDDLYARSVSIDKSGDIWIATLGNGVYRYSPRDSTSRQWQLGDNYVTKIITTKRGDVWAVASDDLLYHYDRTKDDFSGLQILDKTTGMKLIRGHALCQDYSGGLWAAGWDSGIFHYDPETGACRNFLVQKGIPRIKGRIHTLKEIEPGNLMIGSDNGLATMDRNGNLSVISYKFDSSTGLSDNFVYDILRDREGGLWVSTFFGGVNYASPNNRVFTFMTCSGNGSKGRIVSKFCEDKTGAVWIGTDDGGLFRLSPESNRIEKIVVDRNHPDLNIHALLYDEPYLWIGTYGNGLFRMNPENRSVTHFPRLSPSGPTESMRTNESIYSMYQDRSGQIWIGTKERIYTYNDGTFTCRYEGGYNGDIINMEADPKENIWFASIRDGLLKYDVSTGQIEQIGRAYNMPLKISTMCTHGNRVFFGIAGHGIYSFNIDEKSLRRLQAANLDISEIAVSSLIPDKDYLWIASDIGLIHLNLASGNAITLGEEDGLRTDRFGDNSCLLSRSGKLFLGTIDGFNIFSPDSIIRNSIVPQVSVGAFPEKIFKNTPATFSFTSQSYCSPKNNRYRYLLSGVDSKAVEVDYSHPSVTYRKLSKGKYTFTVSSSNNHYIWSDPASVSFEVVTHWWDCTLAIILYAILGLGASAASFRFYRSMSLERKRIKKEKQKYEHEKIRTETELEFFTNIAHELRTPVMLISAPANQLLAEQELPESIKENMLLIKRNSDKLFNLTNQILDFRETASTNLATVMTDMVSTTKRIVSEFTSLAENNGINLSFEDRTDGTPSLAEINRNAYEKILSNLITNGLKFTRDRVTVGTEKIGGKLEISVTDNGAGINRDEQKSIFYAFKQFARPQKMQLHGFGLGLSIANMLARKMDMALSVDSAVGKYSTFTLTVNMSSPVPKGKSALPADVKQEEIQSETIGISVMVIDNDPASRDFLRESLAPFITTRTAQDCGQAWFLLEDEQTPAPDAIICDMELACLHNFHFLTKLRKDINYQHIPILLLSGNQDPSILRIAVENGADAIVTKPVDIDYLKANIGNQVKKRKTLWNSFSTRPVVAIPDATIKTKADETFLNSFSDLVADNLSDPDLDIDRIAELLHMSRSVLYTKVKQTTGKTPNNFIKMIRLRAAAGHIAQNTLRINEICNLVGFNSSSYFAKCFKEEFGVLPKDFSKR